MQNITVDDVTLSSEFKKSLFKKIKIDSRCPRKLKHLPLVPCKKALNGTCPWFSASPNSNFCFFAEQALLGDYAMTLDEIAAVEQLTITNVNSILNTALKKFKKALHKFSKSVKKIIMLMI